MATETTEESLERAYRHVCDGWLPPQAEVLQKIQSRLHAGEYNHNRRKLTQDLKEDFALYMYCLRELSVMVERERRERGLDTSFVLKRTPVEILEHSSMDEIRAVLSSSSEDISKHSIDDMSELQALRFRETMLSASTAELLSQSLEVDPELGFSCGLLRQLGLTLIAWNYPRVYARAVERPDPSMSLDAAIKRVLGFTPALLGLTFARRWNLTEEVLKAVGDPKRPAAKTADVGATLAKICEVGEALARANHPDHYPSALDDWQKAQEEIVRYLGPKGVQTIYERAQDHLKHYVKHQPELVRFSESDALKERIVGSQYSSRLLEKNTFLKGLPEEIRRDLKRIYSRLKPNRILKTNIELLVGEVIPKAGFDCGCIFMYDPEKRALAPAVKIGPIAQDRLRAVKVFSVVAQSDLIASAYSLRTPLQEEVVRPGGEQVQAIAAALGQITPVGVLYLEVSPQFSETFKDDPINFYRAIRQTLSDCLNLT